MKRLIFLLFFCLTVNYLFPSSKDFNNALNLYRLLKTKKVKNKINFSSIVIQKFYSIYAKSKNKKIKAFSMFMIGKTYLYLTKLQQPGNEVFADLTISSFYRVTREFPNSSLCDDALYYVAYVFYYYKNVPQRAFYELNRLISKYPHGDYVKKAKKFIALILKKYPKFKIKKHLFQNSLIKIKLLPKGNFYRMVFVFKKFPNYKFDYDDFNINFVFYHTDLSKKFFIKCYNNKNFKKNISIDSSNSNLLVTVFSGEIISINKFILKNPYRLVVDVEFKKIRKKKYHKRIETIVIDPGHGGKDPGAIYYGLAEKEVTLKIAKLLNNYLKKMLPPYIKIYLTRTTDKYIYLEDRVEFANRLNADLFVSIHCNASRNKYLKGVQTFYLDPYKLNYKIASAGDVDYIINDLLRMAKLSESIKFAKIVHYDLLKYLKSKYRGIENHGVKEAPFYVLVNTKMPSILVEVSFISNPLENRRLRDYNYLKRISLGIAKGIVDYINKSEFVKN